MGVRSKPNALAPICDSLQKSGGERGLETSRMHKDCKRIVGRGRKGVKDDVGYFWKTLTFSSLLLEVNFLLSQIWLLGPNFWIGTTTALLLNSACRTACALSP